MSADVLNFESKKKKEDAIDCAEDIANLDVNQKNFPPESFQRFITLEDNDGGDDPVGQEDDGIKKPKFIPAPQVKEVAIKLINKKHDGHSGLAEAKICYMFRNGKWSSKDQETWGQAVKASPIINALTGYDFIILINHDVWERMQLKEKEALVDHELSHCSRGEDDKHGRAVWYTAPHDIEDFASCVRKYGLWRKPLLRMMEAYNQHNQLTLFDDDKTEKEPETDLEDDNEAIGRITDYHTTENYL